MNTLKYNLVFVFSLLVTSSLSGAGEQDNWYIANEWSVSESRGVFYDYNTTTGQERIFVSCGSMWATTGKTIKLYDINGTLLNTFGSGSFLDIVVDGSDTVYTASVNSVRSFSKSPGRISSVSVNSNGSNMYRHWPNDHFTLTFSGGGGTGGSAYAIMEENSTDTDSYNKFVSSVVINEIGAGYSSPPIASLRSDMPRTSNTIDANFSVSLGVEWGEDWSIEGFSQAQAIALSPTSENLFVADAQNQKIIVLDRNGSIIREFGSSGSAPGQLNFEYGGNQCDLAFLSNGNLAVTDRSYLHFFNEDGTFISRTNQSKNKISTSGDGTILSNGSLRDAEGNVLSTTPFSTNSNSNHCFTPRGDVIESTDNSIRIWKRAYRTKGMIIRNIIPQPAIHSVTQRSGTNILDVDIEIIDPDDANATFGIIAHCGDDKIIPQAWIDETGSKIGVPVATNQLHRLSWNVKQDWAKNTGTIKFEIFCQDANRSKPVDLHLITLPFLDGNMTISRSPLNDNAFSNYANFLLATGHVQFENNESQAIIVPATESNATNVFTFTNAGATGKNGPSDTQLVAEYNGTNLDGNVTIGFMLGYQKWTVPANGAYTIEAVGARGGNQPSQMGGLGAYIRGDFNLTAGQELTIVVGQAGANNPNIGNGTSGGGGTFVVADSNNTPLVVAGGGSGAARSKPGSDATTNTSGLNGSGPNGETDGGTNGLGGQGIQGGGGGGFLGSGTGNSNLEGKSFQLGAEGGEGMLDGGFGGGAAIYHSGWYQGSGGGGYSGGGGAPDGPYGEGGGGGSFNNGADQLNLDSVGSNHGYVRIFLSAGVSPGKPKVFLTDSNANAKSKSHLLEALGEGYRFATPAEVTKAREAATPGNVNIWTASFQVMPRNLPGKVNEYGFDVFTTDGTWVIKE